MSESRLRKSGMSIKRMRSVALGNMTAWVVL